MTGESDDRYPADVDTRQQLIRTGQRKIKAVDAVDASREQWEQALAARYWVLYGEGLRLKAIIERMSGELADAFQPEQLVRLGASRSTIRTAAKRYQP